MSSSFYHVFALKNSAHATNLLFYIKLNMIQMIAPWFPGIWLLSIVVHIIAFYLYVRIDSREKAEELTIF
ncbi:hypothetical protein [Paenibacillus sp. QZ-Y1]|uniref:hypothetical protein n=1 Tax=Paenibacillus sp. QZ-Y1 TaxID=3414511 RepID=UPI003F790BDC